EDLTGTADQSALSEQSLNSVVQGYASVLEAIFAGNPSIFTPGRQEEIRKQIKILGAG
ncbi:hypothetical protein HDU67_003034, partial [Dinochytrium kinnereticum]